MIGRVDVEYAEAEEGGDYEEVNEINEEHDSPSMERLHE
jgi:hypothetical protein